MEQNSISEPGTSIFKLDYTPMRHFKIRKCVMILLYSTAPLLSFSQQIIWQALFKHGTNVEWGSMRRSSCSLVLSGSYNGNGSSNWDIWIAEYDIIGLNLKWEKNFAGSGEDYIYDVGYSGKNAEYFAVTEIGSSDGDFNRIRRRLGVERTIVKKDFPIISKKSYGIDQGLMTHHYGVGIEQLKKGDFVLAGVSYFSPLIIHPDRSYKPFIVRTNKNGRVTWFKTLANPDTYIYDLVVDELSSSIYVVGRTSDRTVPGFHPSSLDVSYDMYVAKYDLDGNLVWQKCYGGSFNDQGEKLIVKENKLFIAGATSSSDGDVPAIHGRPDASSNSDCWLSRLNSSDGTLEWSKTFGGSGTDYFTTITVYGNSVICMGSSNSNDFDLNGYGAVSSSVLVIFDLISGQIRSSKKFETELPLNNPLEIIALNELEAIAFVSNSRPGKKLFENRRDANGLRLVKILLH